MHHQCLDAVETELDQVFNFGNPPAGLQLLASACLTQPQPTVLKRVSPLPGICALYPRLLAMSGFLSSNQSNFHGMKILITLFPIGL